MEKIKVNNRFIWGLICFILNAAGGALSYFVQFPLNLDFLGTILSAVSLNFISTAAISVIPQFLNGNSIIVKCLLAFVYFISAAFLCYGIRRVKDIKITSLVIFSTVIALISSLICSAFSCIFSIEIGDIWGRSLSHMLSENGRSCFFVVFIGLFIPFVFNLQICSNLALGIIQFLEYKSGKRSRTLFRRAMINIGLIIFLIFPVLIIETVNIHYDPERIFYDEKKVITKDPELKHESDFTNLNDCSETIFDKSSGMFSSDANCICETEDGCIWIGSYSGLTKYDGKNFTFLSDCGITNVTAILKDKDGILWIGTNDQGVVRYDSKKDEFKFCKIDSEVSVFSVRSFCQISSGEIYVGTSGLLCKIDSDEKIKVIDHELSYINSLAACENKIIGTTRQGELFLIENDKVVCVKDPVETGIEYTCVAAKGRSVVAGTSRNFIQKLEVEGKNIVCKKNISTFKEFDITSIYIVDENNLFFTTDSVICQVKDGKIIARRYFQNFTKIRSMHVDYENNFWFTSSRYGILKLSKNNFLNIGAYNKVVNAVSNYNDELYLGTDNGLEIVSEGKIGREEIEIYLENSRIRYIYVDPKKNMWFCSYGDKGLVKYSPDKKIELVSTGDYFLYNYRCITNVDDDTLVAGTKANGILFLNSDGTKKLITDEDGLSNLQILSLYVDSKKNVYAGTDGGGIYVLKDQKIVKHISRKEGLTSDVIMKIIPYKDNGAFLVTSNSLCYMENDVVVPLTKFPFYNNFDILFKGTKAYVTTSCGLYELDAEELRQNTISNYKLYNRSMGLDVDFVPNSLNISTENKLVLCTNSGAYTFTLGKKTDSRRSYKFGFSSVLADGKNIKNVDNVYRIPAGTKIILLNPSVKNYSIPDFKFKFYIEGFNDDAPGVLQDEITPLNITNLNYGTYKVWLKILDDYESEVLQEKFYIIKKEAFIWETTWFKFYLVFVCFWIIIDICWSIVSYILFLREELRVQDQQRIQEVIETFTGFVDAKDSYTAGHSTRVANISKIIASRLGYSDDECQNIFYCALLHDSGKIGIPDSILTKPGSLTDDEYAAMKNHTIKGWEILKGVKSIPEAINAARSHHERYDGKGYPDGLAGKKIPELARIICLADAYDAMNTNRCYRNHLEKNVIVDELIKCAGSQFDPDLVEVLISLIKNGVV